MILFSKPYLHQLFLSASFNPQLFHSDIIRGRSVLNESTRNFLTGPCLINPLSKRSFVHSMADPESPPFANFLDRYSEYLTDAANRDDLLQLGRRLFGSSAPGVPPRQSMELLEAKVQELRSQPGTKTTRSRSSRSHRGFHAHVTAAPQSLTQEQITNEILQLRQKNAELREERAQREEERTRMLAEYDRLVHQSVDVKNKLKADIHGLTLELAASLVRSDRPSGASAEVRSIQGVIEELTDLNRQVVRKIGGFRASTMDALSHCERAALDRYKPKMEDLLGRIYDGASDLPIDVIRERIEAICEELDHEISELQIELNTETARNEWLWLRTQQLDERVSSRRDEVVRMKKEGTQLAQEIALLGDLAVAEIAAAKTQYYRLVKDQDGSKVEVLSARAVVISGAQGKKKLPRMPSRAALELRELANPVLASLEDFIDEERMRLMNTIHAQRD
jgi:predicted nuclease with TOPRIM domain